MKTLIVIGLIFIVTTAFYAIRDRKGIFRSQSAFNDNLLEAGKLIFGTDSVRFKSFFTLFITDREKFMTEYEDMLSEHEFEDLKPLEVLYLFGDAYNHIYMIDWKGEENEKEVESYIEKRLAGLKPGWVETERFRNEQAAANQHDGHFIIELFKKVDEDLKPVRQKLLFIDLGWDAYLFTTVSLADYDSIKHLSIPYLHGADELKK